MGEPFATPEDEWGAFLSGTHPHLHDPTPFRFIPSKPRCRLCRAPFGAPGSVIFRRYGYTPWPKNPQVCSRCFQGLETVAKGCPKGEDTQVGGAEVELSMLFADVRGSSKIARQMPTLEFTRLMNRFYRTSSEVLWSADAIVEKFIGDEVVGLFIPFMTGQQHATKAIAAAEQLLQATGHGSSQGPWLPLGVGVNTGVAFVGIVASAGGNSDFTALGDPVNVAAHLAAQAADGEILVTEATATSADLDRTILERRHLSLKGHPVDCVVLGERTVTSAS